MSRNSGQYPKGVSGNLKGRPPKKREEVLPEELRLEFFEDANVLVTITENGKRKKIPARRAINRQLRQKALEGDIRAILAWKKEEAKHIREYVDLQISLMETLAKEERRYQESPEDVPERALKIMRAIRKVLAPEFQL